MGYGRYQYHIITFIITNIHHFIPIVIISGLYVYSLEEGNTMSQRKDVNIEAPTAIVLVSIQQPSIETTKRIEKKNKGLIFLTWFFTVLVA